MKLIRSDTINSRQILNAHEVVIAEAGPRGLPKHPIVRCRVSFNTGNDAQAEAFAARLRDLIDARLPSGFEWQCDIAQEPSSVSRLLHRVVRLLQRLEFHSRRWSLR